MSARAGVIDALLARRRSLLRDAATKYAAGNAAGADVAEAEARALEAWVMVHFGFVTRATLDARRDACARLVRASIDIDAPEARGHRAWLAGYETGRRLYSDVETGS